METSSGSAVAGDPAELARIAAEVVQEPQIEIPRAAPQAPRAGDDPASAAADLAADELERLAGDPGAVANLSEDEIASVVELAFGLAADARGPHWEIESKRARRIATWLKKSLDKRGGFGWLEKWLPEIMATLLILGAVTSRYRIDRKLAAAKVPATESAAPLSHGNIELDLADGPPSPVDAWKKELGV